MRQDIYSELFSSIRIGESTEEINDFLKPFNIYAQQVINGKWKVILSIIYPKQICLRVYLLWRFIAYK
jgi:type II secretory pathway component PulF